MRKFFLCIFMINILFSNWEISAFNPGIIILIDFLISNSLLFIPTKVEGQWLFYIYSICKENSQDKFQLKY